MEPYGGIILAAGSSRRFGRDKRNLQLSTGRTMLEETIHRASAHLQNLMVVVRHSDLSYADQLAEKVGSPSIRFFCAPDSALGMAHSLANAIQQVGDWQAALIILGDLPFILPDTYRLLVERYRQSVDHQPILVPCCAGRTGHPVLFDRAYFQEISQLRGDVGARSIIEAHRAEVIEVEVGDSGILQDIDVPDDI
jgi:molybdenum cofactor cytidylyltransferase